MKLVTIDEGPHGTPGAMLKTGEILRFGRAADAGTLEAWIPETLRALLEAGKAGLAVVRELVDRVETTSDAHRSKLRDAGALTARVNTRLLTPIPEPRLIVCAGLNYRSHLKEMSGTPVPRRPTVPMPGSACQSMRPTWWIGKARSPALSAGVATT